MTAKTRDSVVPRHKIAPEAGFPPDHRGWVRCTDCGLLGKEGDKHHPKAGKPLAEVLNPPQQLPRVPEAARELEARRLGERE